MRQSTSVYFGCLCACCNCSLDFVCILRVHADKSQWIRTPGSLSPEALTSECFQTDQVRKVSTDCKKYCSEKARSHYKSASTHIVVGRRSWSRRGRVRLSPLPGAILFNECSKENDSAVYNTLWLNPLVMAAQYNSQFILLYDLLQLNILWVDSSRGTWFYHWVLIMLSQMGHAVHPSEGMMKMEPCMVKESSATANVWIRHRFMQSWTIDCDLVTCLSPALMAVLALHLLKRKKWLLINENRRN